MKKRSLYVTAMLLFCASFAYAQQISGSITGVVKDSQRISLQRLTREDIDNTVGVMTVIGHSENRSHNSDLRSILSQLPNCLWI